MPLTDAEKTSKTVTAYSERSAAGRDLRGEPTVRVYIRAQWLHLARTPTVMGPRFSGGERVSLPTSEAARLVAAGYAIEV